MPYSLDTPRSLHYTARPVIRGGIQQLIVVEIPELTEDAFQVEVLEAKLPVVVDFGAEWCHPCKQLDPVVEELAKDWSGKVKFLKVDADTSVNTTMRYQVFGLPTLILFKDGEPKERLTGYQPKHRIVHHFAPYLDSQS